MNAWAVYGVELPFGDQAGWWWVDAAGSVHDRPISGADPLPGRFVLSRLVDAHPASPPERPDLPPGRRRGLQEGRARIAEPPVAARLGVPVLASADITGSIPREVALLSQMGLEPKDALAATSVWPGRFPRRRSYRRHRHLPPRSPT